MVPRPSPESLARGLLGAALLASGAASAFPTQAQALALVFPGATFVRKEYFLTDAQGEQVKALAGTPLRSLWVVAYEARKDGKLEGVGFFDTHRVRTQDETTLVAVSPEGKVLRVEVVSFREPQEYLAPESWLKQFEGKALDDALSLKREIHPLSGATLTANALTDASRRCLGLWQVLYRLKTGEQR